MNQLKHFTFLLFSLLVLPQLQAREFVGDNNNNTPPPNNYPRASNCSESRAGTELAINNVRAFLGAGGRIWFDLNRGRYIVPNVDPASGRPQISSLYAGGIWLGAYDDGGNLILAAQRFNTGVDYWTGPLDPTTGTVEKSVCENWDRHFRALGADVDALRADYFAPDPATGQSDNRIDSRPSRGLLGWPARGNPYFSEIYGFNLPDQDLAPFIEPIGREDGIYDPYDGDHPVIEVVGCGNDYLNAVYADEMIWWVFNDRGNVHSESNGQPMSMEIQALAFAYRTTDAVNNMTFYRYKLLNRNTLALRQTYFALWSDPDLGCFLDDKIGVDTTTGMGYVYNGDANDDATCGTSLGYGTAIPALGVDYFRGPLDSAGNQIGLSGFQYHVNNNTPQGDPQSALGYYRLMSGFWPDGTPVTYGNTGYQSGGGGTPTPYVFPSFPNDQSAGSWSMCSANSTPSADFRFLHVSGPFALLPGATNELISGVVWVPELPDYPCPSMRKLVEADVLAQNLFDDCFKITDGPDAPYIDVVELENELVLNLGYINSQNNFQFKYEERPAFLRGQVDSTYNFEGYKIYQVTSANTSVTDLEDPEKARLVYQTDLRNGIGKVTNWSVFPDEDVRAFVPKIMVEGEDKGIQHTFVVKEDKFATRNNKLVNHKPYYFCVVAYGYNQYEQYDPATNTGQALPYLQGRKNFRIYTGIPRNNSPEYFGAVINSQYGDGPEINRLDGKGNGGGLFLNIADQKTFETNVLAGTANGSILYAKGQGPISIKVVDPLRVPKGNYNLYIGDQTYTWTRNPTTGAYTTNVPTNTIALQDSLYWALRGDNDPNKIWFSYQPLDVKYEQYIPEIGLSVSIERIPFPGTNGVSGWVGSSVEYTDSANAVRWYQGVLDENDGAFNMLKTGNAQLDVARDPKQDYSTAVGGWYPVPLCDCRYNAAEFYFTPSEVSPNSNSYCDIIRTNSTNANTLLVKQRNVNIVITPDQSKWSRCIVVETGNEFHKTGLGFGTLPSGKSQLEWKNNQPSVDKDGNADGTGNGKSWFPGYAYDVETGERLNVLFGENSLLNGDFFDANQYPKAATGNDMIYNPTDLRRVGFGIDNATGYLSYILGGQHVVYVAGSVYDECQSLIDVYNTPSIFTAPYRILNKKELIWASYSYLKEGTSMYGGKQNIPPSEVTFKLRVSTPYEIARATNQNQGYPLYSFNLDGLSPTKENKTAAETALDLINIVPNPYYAYSDYEVTEIDNVIKITNLPPKCVIRIYSIDGRFVREFNVAQDYNAVNLSGITRLGEFGSGDIERQILTSVNWDLKNTANVPVSSGVYLVHVVVPNVGERVLKSFIINRAFDAQKL
jgi:hypothetical protein